jgi:hypothetical protein
VRSAIPTGLGQPGVGRSARRPPGFVRPTNLLRRICTIECTRPAVEHYLQKVLHTLCPVHGFHSRTGSIRSSFRNIGARQRGSAAYLGVWQRRVSCSSTARPLLGS